MKILITGGAGYIGSFMTKALIDRGDEITVFDNLERGHKEAIDSKASFIKGDITSAKDLGILFSEKFDAAIHFAGLIAVGESEENPSLYYYNNVEGSKLFFQSAISSGVNNFIFSSSAAVYGNPTKVPIPEEHAKNPTSNYGKNKLEIENILSSLRAQNPQVSFVALRYFNASGASLDGKLGESHVPETHIIPNIMKSILSDETFRLFGVDYKTPDGTCVRDYIHVLDLVNAHILALEKILKDKGEYIYNVGTGIGYSNRQVLEMVEKVSGQKVKLVEAERRAGDADILTADPAKIKRELGFLTKFSDLETIVKTAWRWHSK